jgi:hypothetical protein
MVSALEANFLEPGDYVLGVVINGESRAYPTRFVWWHHVINDKAIDPKTKSETPFAVTYCSVCNTGIRYDLKMGDKTVALDFFGLYNGVVALCDRETESVFLQASGDFVSNALSGKNLKAGAARSSCRPTPPIANSITPKSARSRADTPVFPAHSSAKA